MYSNEGRILFGLIGMVDHCLLLDWSPLVVLQVWEKIDYKGYALWIAHIMSIGQN